MNDTEKVLRKNIGKRIKLARSKTDYTQEQLAEKLSLSARYISQLERGVAFGSATTIVNLCQALNINSDFLFNDIIECNSSSLNDFVDNSFLENYLQLNDYNKEIIDTMVKQLIKLQKKDASKNCTEPKKLDTFRLVMQHGNGLCIEQGSFLLIYS